MKWKWNWYLSITAIKQFMEIQGWSGPPEDSNPHFLAAEEQLGGLSLSANEAPSNQKSGGKLYRGWTMIRGKRDRVELTVMPEGREEGDLPQLVRVRLKSR